ncbi:MAG: hypothetical protein RHS_3088 [Robinsoniella sp. RHS]|nr:MAG: hypothetical protein RHS_3088 [Robinsoniella sp. RHS]
MKKIKINSSREEFWKIIVEKVSCWFTLPHKVNGASLANCC